MPRGIQPRRDDLTPTRGERCLDVSGGRGQVWEQAFRTSQCSPESCSPPENYYPSAQLLEHLTASQREIFMVPGGEELLIIICLSVCLSFYLPIEDRKESRHAQCL